ncbi:MAG: ATP-binding cassette domain-containing protein, partial [Bacteroidota bacterium]
MSNIIVQLSAANIYQGEHLVLESVNMNLVKGEFTYLIGKTGTGKSSLLKTLYAALPLQEGQGRVVNYDLRQVNRKTIPLLRRQLGMVFQDFN